MFIFYLCVCVCVCGRGGCGFKLGAGKRGYREDRGTGYEDSIKGGTFCYCGGWVDWNSIGLEEFEGVGMGYSMNTQK